MTTARKEEKGLDTRVWHVLVRLTMVGAFSRVMIRLGLYFPAFFVQAI